MWYLIICIVLAVILQGLDISHGKSLHHNTDLKILGGNEAKPHSAPFMIYIEPHILEENSEHRFWTRCGGTLISENYVLTAAHCLHTADKVLVYAGVHNVDDVDNKIIQKIEIKSWTIHENFSSETFANDIGIIELPEALKPSPHVDYVKLPDVSNANKTYEGRTARAYGWGITGNRDPASKVLRYVDIEVMSHQVCEDVYRPILIFVHSTEICTPKSAHKGTCGGDSGGPILVDNVQIGITSNGVYNCEDDYPDLYVNVGSFLAWIREHTK